MKKITSSQYQDYVTRHEPKSPLGKNMLFAFIFGGLISVIGQSLTNMYGAFGLIRDDSATAASVTLIFIGAFLTAINVYDKIAKLAGAGASVPITGFANSIVSSAMEFKSEGLVSGMAAKMFTIAGPVLVFGISASVIYGLVLAILKIHG